MTFEIIQWIVGTLISLKFFEAAFKYTFSRSFRLELKKHRFSEEESDAEKLIELYKHEESLPTDQKTHPSVLQAKVNTAMKIDKYHYLLVFLLLKKNISALKYTLDEVKGAWMFVNTKVNNNEMELNFVLSKEKAKQLQTVTLVGYLFFSFLLILVIAVSSYIELISQNLVTIISGMMMIMGFLVYFGKQATQTLYVYSVLKER